MYSILESKNQLLKAEAVRLTQQLVQIPSTSGDEKEVADLVAQQMQAVGFDKVLRDELGNVVGILRGREDSPTLMLNAHMDTAELAEDTAQDLLEPGSIKEDRLYGPGASDCKSGIAACLYAVKLLKRSMLPLRGNLIFAATTAEELGDSVGVRHLMKHTLPAAGLSPDFVILAEPTDLGLYCGHDGWMQVEVRVEGADREQVRDAAMFVYNGLSAKSARDNSRIGFGCFEVHPPKFEKDSATVVINERLPIAVQPEQFLENLRHEVKQLVTDAGHVTVNVGIAQKRLPHFTGRVTPVHRVVNAWNTDPNSQLVEQSRRALDAAGAPAPVDRWQLGMFGTGTAGGVFANEFMIPTIGYGPGDEQVIHSPGEYVLTGNIEKAMYGLSAIIHSLIGVPVFGWTSDEI